MAEWLPIPEGNKKRLHEIKGAEVQEPVEIYAERYRQPVESLHPVKIETIQRHIDEILCELEPGSSLLLFGSGHSIHANSYKRKCKNISKITAMDLVAESQLGLSDDIPFLQADILEYEFKRQYDYIFTTHTLEHFTRDQLLNVVVPKLRRAARKALIVLVPYAMNWEDVYHCCRFYEDDEFAGLATKYKKIRDDKEIVYWIPGTGIDSSEFFHSIDYHENTEENFLLLPGADETLVICFAGLPRSLGEYRFEFFNSTGGLDCTKVYCRDPKRAWYHQGINQETNTISKLFAKLRELVKEINPDRVVCIGASSGAYAAILFGTLLGVDVVHAFGPQTFLSRGLREQNDVVGFWDADMENIYALNLDPKDMYYDLRDVLRNNVKTDIRIHIGTRCVLDQKHANHIRGLPGVRILEYDCDEHAPAPFLKREGLLDCILRGDI